MSYYHNVVIVEDEEEVVVVEEEEEEYSDGIRLALDADEPLESDDTDVDRSLSLTTVLCRVPYILTFLASY